MDIMIDIKNSESFINAKETKNVGISFSLILERIIIASHIISSNTLRHCCIAKAEQQGICCQIVSQSQPM